MVWGGAPRLTCVLQGWRVNKLGPQCACLTRPWFCHLESLSFLQAWEGQITKGKTRGAHSPHRGDNLSGEAKIQAGKSKTWNPQQQQDVNQEDAGILAPLSQEALGCTQKSECRSQTRRSRRSSVRWVLKVGDSCRNRFSSAAKL